MTNDDIMGIFSGGKTMSSFLPPIFLGMVSLYHLQIYGDDSGMVKRDETSWEFQVGTARPRSSNPRSKWM